MNVVKVIDQLGWAYYFIAKEQQKYSHHNITYITQKECENNTFKDADVVFFHEPFPEINKIISKFYGKIIGCYGNKNKYRYDRADLIVGISLPRMKNLAEMYPDKPVVFLPESIDDNFFIPQYESHGFKIGFAGRIANVKRIGIINELKYPVIKKTDWGDFKEKSHSSILEFYRSIDVLVLTSKSESMPRVILEAMACGLPVVSTNVGSICLLLDKEWLIDPQPREQVIIQMNYKLDLLTDRNLRLEIGEKNRKHIENNFSWTKNQPLWDLAFESTKNDKYQEIINKSQEMIMDSLFQA